MVEDAQHEAQRYKGLQYLISRAIARCSPPLRAGLPVVNEAVLIVWMIPFMAGLTVL